METTHCHELSLYTASDEITQTETDVDECTQRMDVSRRRDPESSVATVRASLTLGRQHRIGTPLDLA